ncbi:MAG: LytR/AlgR family response regulator transcription factor [Prolixibacteraceae bacterium]
MHCLIIDDDPLVRSSLIKMLSRDERIQGTLEAKDAFEGINIWNKQKSQIDFILLDIELPEMTGIEFLESIDQQPPVILISSKENYGPDAFEHECVDYILKPVPYQRLLKGISRVEKLLEKKKQPQLSNKTLIKHNNEHIQLDLDDILFVESEENYVNFHTKERSYLVHATLKSIYENLPSDRFYKVQRSIIANIDNIIRIRGNIIEFEGPKGVIEKTTTKKDELLSLLNVLNKK